MRVIVVGGFLGAGKTTLLAQAAKHFAAQGKRVGVITNDQAADLVDTHFLSDSGIAVREVAGGCFCCRFEDFERAAENLLNDMQPDILLSEPVGSCTDISATVLQPMKQKWGKWAKLSPFSVLIDPRRLQQALNTGQTSFPESVRYIIKKQLEEADYLVINKIDLLSQNELNILKDKIALAWPGIKVLEMSALNNQGVAEWLDTLSGASSGGSRIIDVDYDTYASGEAELGWLNTSISLRARRQTDWGIFADRLIRQIHGDLASRQAEIGHLKLLISNSCGQALANATSIGELPTILSCFKTRTGAATLILNARALVDPQVLRSIVESSINAVAGDDIEVGEVRSQSFKPAYPRPTYRNDKTVDL